MKITDVVLTRITGTWNGPDFSGAECAGSRQSQAMDVYPELSRGESWTTRVQGPRSVREIYLEIETDAGFSGLFGPIDDAQAFVIDRFLRPFLLDRDPLATEALLDQMLRLNRHGRSGLFMTGVSPVDCALWDLKGKAWGQPVYRLLGGPTRTLVPAYASMLGFSIEPDAAVQVALDHKAMGFEAQKWFFRYGPGDGEAGKVKNLALAEALRDALGTHYTLMFDAFWGWDTTYAVEMVKKLAPLNPWWMEEPVQPERIGGLRRIRQASTVPVATGEHVYTRWQVKELLVNEAVDVLQTDPDWTGGITELVKICALASAFEVPMIAHGHSLLAALHVAGAQSPNTVPMVEYLIRHQAGKQFFHNPTYQPEQGKIALPTLPGLGLVLDECKIESRERMTFQSTLEGKK